MIVGEGGRPSPINQYYGFSLRLAFRYIGNLEKAQTVAQEVLFKLDKEYTRANKDRFHKRLHELLIDTSIYKAVHSRDPITYSHPAIWDLPDGGPQRDEAIVYKYLILVLISLPLLPRLLYNLCGIEGWPPVQAALRLGIEPSRAEALLTETRSRLMEKVAAISAAQYGLLPAQARARDWK